MYNKFHFWKKPNNIQFSEKQIPEVISEPLDQFFTYNWWLVELFHSVLLRFTTFQQKVQTSLEYFVER